MNGAYTTAHDEAPTPSQLPTPARSPSPSHTALPVPDRRDIIDGVIDRFDGNGSGSVSLSASSGSRRPSFNDEAVLSDTSEKIRPVPLIIKRPGDARRKSSVSDHERGLKLSPKQIMDLTSEPTSLPIRAATPIFEEGKTPEEREMEMEIEVRTEAKDDNKGFGVLETVVEMNGARPENVEKKGTAKKTGGKQDAVLVVVKTPAEWKQEKDIPGLKSPSGDTRHGWPALNSRAISTPPMIRRKQSSRGPQGHVPPPLNLDHKDNMGSALKPSAAPERHRDAMSPKPASMPLPPLSMPTFLSLELSADRPSPLYIYRPSATDFPYESSKMKYERLVNFLFLPPKLEGILGFGALACLDAWMHILTILPLRFVLAVFILVKWWGSVVAKECRDVASFVYSGLGRVWRRRRRNTEAPTPLMTPAEEESPVLPNLSRGPSVSVNSNATAIRENGTSGAYFSIPEPKEKRIRSSRYRHRRTKSTPSALLPSHKADILKGLLVIMSCAILMRFDPSRMYHGIRGQSAIKLYVIYNVLEVCDRLLSAVGQDVLECLFSRETLDRNSDGRSKVIRPFWMFILALVYNVAHATALFYQVITLNVAVNSYSNALLTLLLSNQFVEIKGTVFKKFEKENLFQVTCADIVERFQLWLMLLIIAMRNIVEVGGLSIRSSGDSSSSWTSLFAGAGNSTAAPFTASIIPRSFTIFPTWIGQVLNPFVLVLGSEMLVDWLKHAYITKFNQTKPEVYDKFLDVLAKDYYSNVRNHSLCPVYYSSDMQYTNERRTGLYRPQPHKAPRPPRPPPSLPLYPCSHSNLPHVHRNTHARALPLRRHLPHRRIIIYILPRHNRSPRTHRPDLSTCPRPLFLRRRRHRRHVLVLMAQLDPRRQHRPLHHVHRLPRGLPLLPSFQTFTWHAAAHCCAE